MNAETDPFIMLLILISIRHNMYLQFSQNEINKTSSQGRLIQSFILKKVDAIFESVKFIDNVKKLDLWELS